MRFQLESPIDTAPLPADLMRSYHERLKEEADIVAKSRSMKGIVEMLSELASEKKPLSIIGPRGAGRRTVARAIHLLSHAWWRPFVEIDLSGIDDESAYKHLFGIMEEHLFTAAELKRGLVSRAAFSTLCLKNFDGYSKYIQREILNVYVDRQFRPVGSTEIFPLDCRLIFTIRKSPDELLKNGMADDDMAVMLSQRIIEIPPLSERKDDIVPLAAKFIADCCDGFGLPRKRLSKDAEKWLKKAPWNGNVSQLKKSVYFACSATEDSILLPSHFALAHDENIREFQEKQLGEISMQSIVEKKLESFLARLGRFEAVHLYEAIMDRVEEPLIRLVMNYARGNQIRASRMLGINRNTLRSKLIKYKIRAGRNNGKEKSL